MSDKCYLNHELQHIFQFHQLGTFRFLYSYLKESVLRGYYNNKFEVEARAAETKEPEAEFIFVSVTRYFLLGIICH